MKISVIVQAILKHIADIATFLTSEIIYMTIGTVSKHYDCEIKSENK